MAKVKEEAEKAKEKENKKVERKQDEIAERIFNEVKEGKRLFEVEGFGEFELRFPTSEHNRIADWKYSKTYMDAIQEGLPLEEEIMAVLVERGLWSEQSEKDIDVLRDKISNLELLLSKADENDKSKATKKIAQELFDKRNKVIKLQGKKQGYILHAAETKAEEVKMVYLLSQCVFKDGKLLWPSAEELDNENRVFLVHRINMEFSTFQAGLTTDFIQNLPESKYITV